MFVLTEELGLFPRSIKKKKKENVSFPSAPDTI